MRERSSSEGQIPPLAEVILMHFAVAFLFREVVVHDSFFSSINLVAALRAPRRNPGTMILATSR